MKNKNLELTYNLEDPDANIHKETINSGEYDYPIINAYELKNKTTKPLS